MPEHTSTLLPIWPHILEVKPLEILSEAGGTVGRELVFLVANSGSIFRTHRVISALPGVILEQRNRKNY